MTHGQTLKITTRVLQGVGEILHSWRQNLVLVHGDTTTALLRHLAVFMRIPIAHVEAGLRTEDLSNPFPRRGEPPLDRCPGGHSLCPHGAGGRECPPEVRRG